MVPQHGPFSLSVKILVFFKSDRLHSVIFRYFFIKLRYIPSIPLFTIGNSPEVSNFSRLFLKLNRFICNYCSGRFFPYNRWPRLWPPRARVVSAAAASISLALGSLLCSSLVALAKKRVRSRNVTRLCRLLLLLLFHRPRTKAIRAPWQG